ncbi:MAG: hypothetical protein QNJ45_17085 [Ardenticatenaceae bacterium]|nr:hypothetical protein [Ardenticatenaceae bacterium]
MVQDAFVGIVLTADVEDESEGRASTYDIAIHKLAVEASVDGRSYERPLMRGSAGQ